MRLLRLKWFRWVWTDKLFTGQWAPDTYGHQGRDTLQKRARDHEVEFSTDTVAHIIHEHRVVLQSSKPNGQSLSCMGNNGWNLSMWRCARLCHTPTNLPREAYVYSGGSNHPTVGSICHVTCHCPECYPRALKNKSYGNMAPQKQLNQITCLISETW